MEFVRRSADRDILSTRRRKPPSGIYGVAGAGAVGIITLDRGPRRGENVGIRTKLNGGILEAPAIRLSIRRVAWGAVLALVAAVYFYSAVRPTGNDNPYLFGLIAIGATVGSFACLFPNAVKGIGRVMQIAFWVLMAGLALWGIIAAFSSGPIPTSIIIGALIIASAIAHTNSGES